MSETRLGPVVGSRRSARGAVASTGGAPGWSTSARWEGCTKTVAAPRIRHILRDVEEQQGLYRKHSNELIDPAATSANFSFRFVTDEDGSIRKERITDVDSVFAHLNSGLAKVQRYRTVPEFRMVIEKDADGNKIPEVDAAGEPVLDKKGKPVYRRRKEPMPSAGARVPVAMGKDTVVAVEELFQLDPEYTGSIKDMTPAMRAEVQRLYEVWYADLVDQYGAQNILCVSEHWDETSPHVSAFAMPLAERGDGTAELNVKLFTTGKKKPTRAEAAAAYSAKHDRLRGALREANYEATFERITPRNAQGFPAKGASLDNFKRAAKRATAAEREEIQAEAELVKAAQDGLVEREGALVEREATFEAKRAETVAAVNAAIDEADEKFAQADEALAAAQADREAAASARTEGYEAGLEEGRAAWEQTNGPSYREKVRDAAVEQWEREERPGLVSAAEAEGRDQGRTEIEEAMRADRAKTATDAKEIAEALAEAQRRRDAVPEYDRFAAVQAMEAARFDAGEVLRIVQRTDGGSIVRDEENNPVMVKVNQELDREAERIYRLGTAEAGLTVAERSRGYKGDLREGGAVIAKTAEQSKQLGHEDLEHEGKIR